MYIDDIIVYGPDFETELGRLIIIWGRLREAQLKLKPSKCKLFREKTPFLGHVVSRQGIEVDPKKMQSVKAWPVPTKEKEVRSFLGLASYYRRFIPGFATLAAPLHGLTKKDANFPLEWTKECQQGFDKLKLALTTAPVLSYPQREGAFFLSTDASDDGLGAVLEQDQAGPDGKVERKVVAYASKILSRTQRRYCTTNKELLAVVTACEQFRYYLLGRPFTVITDHASLLWLRNFKDPEGMVARWMARLAAFDYDIVHRPGVLHGHADGLSRRKGRACKRLDCKECMPLRVDGKMTTQERCYPVPGGLEDEAVHGQDVEDEDVGMEAMFVPPTQDHEVPVQTPGLDAGQGDPVQAVRRTQFESRQDGRGNAVLARE